ncbi:MAG: peptidoglycan recognition family protein [Polyangiaceae bacterium]
MYGRRFSTALLVTVASLSLASCGAPRAAEPTGATGRMIVAAADRHGVPRDLMLAIAAVEGGLALPAARAVDPDDDIHIAGVLELRHGAFDSLAKGAALTGLAELELERDLALGTDAGARVLDALAREDGIARDDLDAWSGVVERLSGHRDPAQRADYRARVFDQLARGATLRARGGETIVLPPHDEISASLRFAPPVPKVQGMDYAPAQTFPTDCTDKCSTTRTGPIKWIAIHDTEGGWDASVATLQNDPGKSVHYQVDHDGSRVGQFIPESYDGWHVGNSYYNNRMVGIEHVGKAAEDDYRVEMYAASALLIKDIAKRHDIPLDRAHMIAHQEVPDGGVIPQDSPPCTDSPGQCVKSPNYGGANNHRDPGVNWEWCQFMELVGDGAPGTSCKCNDTFGLWNCVHDLSMMNRCVDGVVEIQHCATPCVVEPIGTDDHCEPVMGAGGAASSSSSAAVTTASSTGAVHPVMTGGAGGTGGAPDVDIHGSCSCRVNDPSSEAPWSALGAVAALGLAVARRRVAR